MPRLTDHTENMCLATPGLAIIGAGTATIKTANAITFKANGRVSTSVAAFQVATSVFAAATQVGVLPNGTASTAPVLATGYGRTYALVATLQATATTLAQAPAFSVICGPDYLVGTETPPISSFPQVNNPNQCIVGWVMLQNLTGSNFTQGTTALDATNLLVKYLDNFGIAGS